MPPILERDLFVMFSLGVQSPEEPKGTVSLTGFVWDNGSNLHPLGKSAGHSNQLGWSSWNVHRHCPWKVAVVRKAHFLKHTGLVGNHLPPAEKLLLHHGPDLRFTSLLLHRAHGRSQSRHTENIVGAGDLEMCKEWQGKMNSEGDTRLLKKGGRKATAHQAEPSVLQKRSRGGCLCALPGAMPSIWLLLTGKEFQRTSTFFVMQRRCFLTDRLRSVTPALWVRETRGCIHPGPDGVTQLSVEAPRLHGPGSWFSVQNIAQSQCLSF